MQQATKIIAMPRYRPNPEDNPEKADCEGWLVNSQRQLVSQCGLTAGFVHGHQ